MASKLVNRARRVLTPALYWDTDLEVVRAEGVYVWGRDRKRYLDFTSGTATTNIGHCPPRVVAAAKKQLENLIHAGCVYYYESIVALGEELARIMPGDIDMFFFSNSGAEAVEGALKLARYVTGRHGIVAFEGAFHGRTLGCVSITSSNVKYRRHYAPLLPSVYLLPFPYVYRSAAGSADECVRECIGRLEELLARQLPPDELAAIVVEPVQGEGGYIVPPVEFLAKLREIATRTGAMLIFDEVQTGFGRTGRWFACEHFGVVPDIMAVAKGIASGFPLSAVGAPRAIMEKWAPGAHGTTFGGNPVACAAALATIQTIEEEDLLRHAAEQGEYLMQRLVDMQNTYPIIGDVRGLGLMIGIEFVREGKKPNPEAVAKVRKICQRNGLLLIACGSYGNVIRFIPPLIVTRQQLDEGLAIFEEAVARMSLAAASYARL